MSDRTWPRKMLPEPLTYLAVAAGLGWWDEVIHRRGLPLAQSLFRALSGLVCLGVVVLAENGFSAVDTAWALVIAAPVGVGVLVFDLGGVISTWILGAVIIAILVWGDASAGIGTAGTSMALIAGLVQLGWTWRTLRRTPAAALRQTVYVFQQGLIQTEAGTSTACRWDEVEELYEDVEGRKVPTPATGVDLPTGSDRTYTIVLKDGVRWTLTSNPREPMHRLPALWNEIRASTHQMLLARAVADLESSGEVAFGPVTFTRTGVFVRSKDNYRTWPEIKDVQIDVIGLTFWQEGRVQSRRRWHSLTVADIPNVSVLITLGRCLAGSRPDQALSGFVRSPPRALHPLGEAGHRDAVSAHTRSTVALLRRMDAEQPQTGPVGLAEALTYLADRATRAGLALEALEPSRLATGTCRRLVADDPGLHLPRLARSLHDLSCRLAVVGQTAEALACAQEAMSIRRRLSEQDPVAHRADLAVTLQHRGVQLAVAGRHREAFDLVGEAVSIRRRLAVADPEVHRPDLAASLGVLGWICTADEQDADAGLTAVDEAVTLFTRLAKARPGQFENDVKMTQATKGQLLQICSVRAGAS